MVAGSGGRAFSSWRSAPRSAAQSAMINRERRGLHPDGLVTWALPVTNSVLHRHTPCDRALLNAEEAVSQSGIPIAILVQPAPHGVSALSQQIRHQPSSNSTSA